MTEYTFYCLDCGFTPGPGEDSLISEEKFEHREECESPATAGKPRTITVRDGFQFEFEDEFNGLKVGNVVEVDRSHGYDPALLAQPQTIKGFAALGTQGVIAQFVDGGGAYVDHIYGVGTQAEAAA